MTPSTADSTLHTVTFHRFNPPQAPTFKGFSLKTPPQRLHNSQTTPKLHASYIFTYKFKTLPITGVIFQRLYPNRTHPPDAPPFMTGSTHHRPHLSKAPPSKEPIVLAPSFIIHTYQRPHRNRTHPPDVPPFTSPIYDWPQPFTNSTSQTPPTTGPTNERLLHRRPGPTDSTPRPHTSETTPTRINP